MTLVSPSQSNPGDTIEASDINDPVNQIAAVVNGNIDSTNISSVSGSKLQAGTVAASALDTNANVETRMSESLGNFVASGLIWSTISGLNATMTTGVAYINGKRLVVSAIASRTFTASKDTYVSVDVNGTVSYSEVANGVAQPSLPANSVWISKVVSSASAITSVTDIRDVSTASSGNFSTQETNTGTKWIDGKTIYKKTINTGSLNGVTTKSVAHSITGISYIVGIEAIAATATPVYYPIPLNSALSGSAIAGISIDVTNVVFGLATSSSGITSSYVTIKYTKV